MICRPEKKIENFFADRMRKRIFEAILQRDTDFG